jgi:hypothetical protein
MNLQPINPPLRDGQYIQCCKCRKMSHDVMADMDGEPFRAFYCAACLRICTNCGHAESEHNPRSGPCNVKEPDGTHCTCYQFGGAR